MSTNSIAKYQYEDSGLRSYLSYIRNYPSLNEEEESILTFNVYERQDRNSAEKLVLSHMKLVVKTAYNMQRYGLVLIDLIGEGSLGLMQAVKKYDPNVGVRFSSYAKWWIKAYIQEYIIKSWSLVKLGTTIAQKKLFFHLKKAKEKILLLHRKEALSDIDCKAIAEELSVKTDEVKEMDLRLGSDISLDTPLTEEENSASMLDYVGDSRQGTEEIVLSDQMEVKQKELVKQAISSLNARETGIISHRHFQDNPETLAVLSKKYGISRERIRQIETIALAKITKYCRDRHPSVAPAII
jgi:RNA polymerase sigma-32 factor